MHAIAMATDRLHRRVFTRVNECRTTEVGAGPGAIRLSLEDREI
jgi:hypothetical protein